MITPHLQLSLILIHPIELKNMEHLIQRGLKSMIKSVLLMIPMHVCRSLDGLMFFMKKVWKEFMEYVECRQVSQKIRVLS